ncbi:DUF4249 domain-containing protein [Pedobacter sp. PLR]|uniref:DUF4249 domain-containing protein n=1 Tax=Pedobacter sp. PLR TaxID=2994465 RepID=UPI0022452CFC|nr:DUF4249 domain-containing protein [Pedobacter sp. PLR]MCX2450231.1 DUF4249 domain-containing protein [Pedobacter sp. PLR]
MKKIKLYIGLIMIFLFTACEQVIELKLEEATPLVVIDGGISDQNEVQRIKISKTYSFTEPNKFNGASGAKVVLGIDGTGSIVFTEVSPGIYQSVKFRGKSGSKYDISVTLEGQTYKASSVMPVRVPMDSLTFKSYNLFGETKNYVAVNYRDPAGVANQYRYILRFKGVVEKDVVSEDRFDDGNKVTNVIFYELNDLIKGDSIQVEIQCIDRNVYRYFYSLGQNSGGGGPPVAPANPPSNFSNGALGVFSAYTSSIRTALIK